MKGLSHTCIRAKNIFVFCLFLIFQNQTYAQKDTVQQMDSLFKVQQKNTFEFISESKKRNVNDSIQEVILMAQLEVLETSDDKRVVLESKIDSLQNNRSQRSAQVEKIVENLRAKVQGVPVLFFKDTLCNVYAKLGNFSPEERAQHTQSKLEEIVKENDFDENEFAISKIEDSFDILYGDRIIAIVTPRDAFWVGKPAKEIATNLVEELKIILPNYKKEHDPLTNLIRIGLLIAVLVVFFILIKYINKGIMYANRKLITKYKHLLKGVKLKNYEFLSQEKELRIIRFLFKTLRWILIITLINIALPTILSIFPATEELADKLIGFILTPLKNVAFGFLNFIPSLFAIVIIITITRYIIKFLKFLSVEITNEKLKIPGFYPDWSQPTFNLLKVVLYAFSFVVIFPYLPGSDSPIFKGVSVFIGLLISLGSSSAIGNIIAGLVITYMRAFKIGDRVKISNTVGDVIEKTMLVTRVRTPKNEEVSIPNAAILSGSTINYSSSSDDSDMGLILNTTVTIGYDAPWPKVHEILIGAANKTELIDADPKPFVLQTSLDDFYVSYQLNAYTKKPKSSPKIYSELHANIQDGFNTSGIEILSPHYRAGRDGNSSTIPSEYLGEEYKAPPFHVRITKKE